MTEAASVPAGNASPAAGALAGLTGLAGLTARYWEFLRHEFPLSAQLAGQPLADPTMFREAPADAQRRADRAGAMLAELQAIDARALPVPDRITARLLARELSDLQQQVQTLSHLKPWLLPAGPEFNAVYFANNVQLGRVDEARHYVEQLQTLDGYFGDVRAAMQEGFERGVRVPRVVLAAALAGLRRLAALPAAGSPWLGPFQRAAGTLHDAGDAAEAAVAVVEGRVRPALQAWADFVEHTLLPAARDSLSCLDDPAGPACYAHWCEHFTTEAALTPEAIHRLGLDQVQRLEAEIAELAAQAGHAGDVAAYKAFLRHEPAFTAASAEELREQVESVAKRIDGAIPALIPRLPRMTYGVRSIPAALSPALPLAYAQPNTGDGRSAGVFWISGLPARVPRYLQLPVTLHEAWPGHLMHIALMQEMDTLPMFRRANFTKYTACLEGWAMYCESLGVDMGLYDSPHQHYGRLDMELWRACRLVVDTGIHLHRWTRAQAVAYMAARLSLPPPAIEAEVDRYIAMPGQALGYLVGGLKFRDLRRRAERRLGARFDLRAFHGELLGAGAVTLPLLDEQIEGWIAAQEAAP
jgi:uncharacterized protein (DUF885 family)